MRWLFLTSLAPIRRGDVDDRVLPEAILPLLEALAASEDVRPILHRRFDMPRWLASHGITSASISEPAKTVGEPCLQPLFMVRQPGCLMAQIWMQGIPQWRKVPCFLAVARLPEPQN